MPYDLPLPPNLRKAGWRVKIHDFERLEPPHVTIYRKMNAWRLNLRDGTFLDSGDKWSQIENEVREAIEAAWDVLGAEWDALHPENPISSHDEDE